MTLVANAVKPPHECGLRDHPRLRPPRGGWPVPVVGDRVWFRGDCYTHAYELTVLGVVWADLNDPNVWTWEAGRPALVAHPNPDVTLGDGKGFEVTTRQVRYRGSPGYFFTGQG